MSECERTLVLAASLMAMAYVTVVVQIRQARRWLSLT